MSEAGAVGKVKPCTYSGDPKQQDDGTFACPECGIDWWNHAAIVAARTSKAAENVTPEAQAWAKLEAAIDRYIDGYELRDAEDADGNCGDYTPTDSERMLITDCIMGLLVDDEIMAMIKALP